MQRHEVRDGGQGKGAKWLAFGVVALVIVASGVLVGAMKQASRPAELAATDGSSAPMVRPGHDAPELPPPHRRLGEMPVADPDRVVLNGLVEPAKGCLGEGLPRGYLTVLLEVAPAGQPLRAIATSFAGRPLAAAQADCIATNALALRFSRGSSTRLMQRRFFLGGGAPPVEGAIAAGPTDASLSDALQQLGDLRRLCAGNGAQAPLASEASLEATLTPEGTLVWMRSADASAAAIASCLAASPSAIRLPPTQTAASVALRTKCTDASCTLTARVEGLAEVVE